MVLSRLVDRVLLLVWASILMRTSVSERPGRLADGKLLFDMRFVKVC
jgi:hypothetical protein